LGYAAGDAIGDDAKKTAVKTDKEARMFERSEFPRFPF